MKQLTKNIINTTQNNRRDFMKVSAGLMAATGAASLAGCSTMGGGSTSGRVVVIGGGFGGATVAKYLRMWSNQGVAVTLIEPNAKFVSCPYSNLVLAGYRSMDDITIGYDKLASRWGVKIVADTVASVDTQKKTVKTAGGQVINYDRLVMSPGIDFMYDEMGTLKDAAMQAKVLHAWKAGPQTVQLRQQLESMKDGGVYALAIPKAPYRCPPGPYERASVVASYFKKHKPKSKVLILDANEKVQSKEGLFKKAWADLYPDIIEYRFNNNVIDVEAKGSSFVAATEFDKITVDVLNVVPPQRASNLVSQSGLKMVNNRWAEVNWLSMESTNTPFVHVLGDAVFPAPTMPKSGHMANQHAKLAAAAILNMLSGKEPNPEPLVMNTCYSFVDENSVIHVSSVHTYDAATKLVQPVKGAGGISAARNVLEVKHANAWATNIWADMLE